MPTSRGICFLDIYLDQNYCAASKAPANNCYLHTGNNFHYTSEAVDEAHMSLDEIRQMLSSFIKSFYFNNGAAFKIKLAKFKLAFERLCDGKYIYEIDDGAGLLFLQHINMHDPSL